MVWLTKRLGVRGPPSQFTKDNGLLHMEKVQDIAALSDDDLFSEWKDWFTYYRNQGELPEDERKYFRELCTEMKKRGLVSKTVPSLSGFFTE